MSVTIYDIAKAAGVDKSTVSMTLRNHPLSQRLRAETRERIVAAAKALGYTRNSLASSTRTGVVKTIALVISSFDSEYLYCSSNFIMEIQRSAESRGFGVRLFSMESLEKSFEGILSNRITNVIVRTIWEDSKRFAADFCGKHSLNLVFATCGGLDGFPGILPDHRAEMRTLTEHFIASGHTRIAYICSPHRAFVNALRHEGYLDAMRGAGLAIRGDWQSCGEYPDKERVGELVKMSAAGEITAVTGGAAIWMSDIARTALKCGLPVPALGCIASKEEAKLLPFPLAYMESDEVSLAGRAVSLLFKEGDIPAAGGENETCFLKSKLVCVSS